MRLIAAALVVAACIATAALAQDTPPADTPPAQVAPTVVTLHWLERPDARDFARNYPRRARDADIPGAAVICCTVREDGRLDCEAPFEWPRDQGFGEATLRISEKFRLDTERVPNAAGGRVRQVIVWQMGDRTPELQSALDRIRQGTANICGPVLGQPVEAVVTTQQVTRTEP